MKKYFQIIVPATIILLFAGLIGATPAGNGQESVKAKKGIEIPADLDKVFTNSCMPCHSENGKALAKSLLNFSKWDKYGTRTQVKKSRAICKMISKGEMPPAQFVESSPELAVTQAQKESICNWVNTTVLKK